jgi:glutamate-ammonia-ligase adenylyltransferase
MSTLNVKDLLLAERLDPQQATELLSPYGFKEPLKADANLQTMADDPAGRLILADLLEELLSCAAQSADPDRAINHFERFARAAVNSTHLFSYLKESPRTLEILAKTFGGSQYMAEILIRDPGSLYWLVDSQALDQRRQKRDIARDLLRALRATATEEKQMEVLRAFKRREMLRIGVRDLLRFCSVEETLADLSTLAETLISAAYRICEKSLRREYGVRRNAFGGFTVLGMGKLGGGELNFSSDVDLIYLYESDEPEVAAGESYLTASPYFRRLSQKITAALSDFTSEGYVYRVDLRLRPEGKMGNIAYSLEGFRRYYDSRGETWERLMLLKTWPVAGDNELGRKFLEMVRPFVYERGFDLKAIDDVRRIKKKIDRKMTASRQHRRNVKLGFGGIREIELIVQSFQVSYGGKIHEVCNRNTLESLRALCDHSLISEEEHDILSRAYIFLRNVENKLQMVNDAQTHSIPTEAGELTACARMLGYEASDRFLGDLQAHTEQVNRIFESVFNAPEPMRFHQIE